MSDADARALVEAWLAAQNRGDFAAYERLYAARFQGVKRAGSYVRNFDRAHWLDDRKRMFAPPATGRPMAVELRDVAIVRGAGSARARFVQAFSRGAFQDRGEKELVLTREQGRLRIAREAMLSSEMTSATRTPELSAEGHGFFFVLDQGVVLSRGAERSAARGPLTLVTDLGGIYVVRSALDESKLDESVRRYKGKKFELYAKQGPVCVATVADFALLVRVDPHFSTTQIWSGAMDAAGEPTPNGKPLASATIAKEAWEMTEPILVGTLTGGCQASLARDPSLPRPALASVTDDLPAPLRAEVERQVRKNPAVAAAEQEAKTATDREEGAPEPMIEVTRVTAQGSDLAVARFENHGGCADYVGMTFVFRVTGAPEQPKLTLLNDPSQFEPFTPEIGLDLDLDGRLELFGVGGSIGPAHWDLLRPDRGYADSDTLAVASFDCYC